MACRYCTAAVALTLAASLVVSLGGRGTLASRIKIEAGWTEVRAGWPLDARDFFVATEQGHHFIKVRDLPSRSLAGDLRVSLEYYYNYTRAEPLLQMIPCRSNILLLDERIAEQSNTWLRHEAVVRKSDCLERNELAYNVLLHDEGDLFAWRLMEVKSEPAVEPTTSTSTSTTTSSTTADEKEDIEEENSSITDDEPERWTTISAAQTPSEPTTQEATWESTTGWPGPLATTQADLSGLPTPTASLAGLIGANLEKLLEDTTTTTTTTTSRPMRPDEPEDEAAPNLRYKRLAAPASQWRSSQKLGRINESCRPSSCDRQKFELARFSALVNGLPPSAGGGDHKKVYINLKDEPLRMRLESSGAQLSELDSCLKFQLFMERNTELELLLEEPDRGRDNKTASSSSSSATRQLEVIRRQARDSRATSWERHERCISDFMPKLEERFEGADDSLRFLFRPRASLVKGEGARAGPLAMMVDTAPNEAGYLRALHPLQSHLPDIRLLAGESSIDKFWLLDGSSRFKPKLELKGPAGSSNRTLLISNIDATTRDTFDITSRWLAIKQVELLEQPVLFVYRAQPADWVSEVEFQYQRAGDSLEQWKSQVVFTTPVNSRQAATEAAAAAAAAAGLEANKTSTSAPIELPIRLRGIDASEEFRIRLRHRARPLTGREQAAAAAGSGRDLPLFERPGRTLAVGALAFADACSYRTQYCFNGGQCRPIGPAEAECLCPAGHSGALCEHRRPCDILYAANQSGHQVCASLGARCVEGLPVMRCEWPNDNYYQCQKLYKLDQANKPIVETEKQDGRSSNVSSLVGKHQTSGGDDESLTGKLPAAHAEGTIQDKLVDNGPELDKLPKEEQVAALRGLVNSQAKTIIILGVFIVAIVVFALVLVGSMVARLRKSGQRLRQTRSDIQQMVRRVSGAGTGAAGQAIGSAGSAATSFNRASGAKTVGYNNSAFDVE